MDLLSKAGLAYLLKGTSKQEEEDKEKAKKKELEDKKKKAEMTNML